MAQTTQSEPRQRRLALLRVPSVGQLLLVSAACLAGQVSLTDYGEGGTAAAIFWFVVLSWLLWLVYRNRNWVARILLMSSALIGTIVTGVQVFTDGGSVLPVLLFAGEGLPLLFPQVADHVRAVEPVADPDAEPGTDPDA